MDRRVFFSLNLDFNIKDWEYILFFLNRQVVYHDFSFGEVGFSWINILTLKAIDPFEVSNTGIEA